MKVGVTGSRNKIPDSTMSRLLAILKEWNASELHHGDCVGFDEQAHRVAVSLGIKTISHPPLNSRLRAYCSADVTHEPLPYLKRNQAIVIASEKIIAAPSGPEVLRSGTWSTIRFAKKIGKHGIILMPEQNKDGT